MLDINPLSYRLFANTFSHSQGGLPFFFFFLSLCFMTFCLTCIQKSAWNTNA